MNEKPVILIVDDTACNLQLLAQLLKDEYRIKVAKHGHKALELAQTIPDLILLDIVMPDMDGYEVCKQIKANDKTREIPIIFITGKSDLEDEKQGLLMGAVDYITRPFHPAIVEARVKTQITLKQQYKQLRHMAMHDQLMGLYNRHYLLDIAVKKMARAKRHDLPLSMIMLDIDHFKAINDQHGHTIGDVVLKEIATVLKKYCRTEDVAARIGGEEFIMLLEYCNIDDCQIKAEQLRHQIEQLMPHEIKVTASFGITEYRSEDISFETFFSRADHALYEAKETGRNQVVIAAASQQDDTIVILSHHKH